VNTSKGDCRPYGFARHSQFCRYRRRFLHPFQDLVVCAVTDGQGAANEPVRAKVTRIVVTGVGQEQKVALSVTAWEIPY